jgi:hypothetical protein
VAVPARRELAHILELAGLPRKLASRRWGWQVNAAASAQ